MDKETSFNARNFIDTLNIVAFKIKYDYNTRQGKFVYLNKKGKEFFSKILTQKQLKVGFIIRDILSEVDLTSPALKQLNQLLTGKSLTLENQEYLLKTQKGQQLLIVANMYIVKNKSILEVNGILNEKAKINETIDTIKMKKEIEGFRELFQVFNGIIMIVDEEGRILFVSPNVDESYLYKPRNQVIGKTFSEIFPEGLTNFFMSMITDVVTSLEIRDIEYHLPIQNKVKWFKATALPIERNEGELRKVITIIWEITQLKIKTT